MGFKVRGNCCYVAESKIASKQATPNIIGHTQKYFAQRALISCIPNIMLSRLIGR